MFQSDLTQDELSSIIPANTVDIVLLFFVLSSITPDKMITVLINLAKVCPNAVRMVLGLHVVHRY